jgi:DNA primase
MPGYADKAMETAGLSSPVTAAKRYDRFRDRIMFPIHDGGGRVIGSRRPRARQGGRRI